MCHTCTVHQRPTSANKTVDKLLYARWLTQVRTALREGTGPAKSSSSSSSSRGPGGGGVHGSRVVSVATGTGVGHTDVLKTSAADEFISMGTYFDVAHFEPGIVQGIADVGVARYAAGLCDSCALIAHNNTAADIDYRFDVLDAKVCCTRS